MTFVLARLLGLLFAAYVGINDVLAILLARRRPDKSPVAVRVPARGPAGMSRDRGRPRRW